jgi:WD40 repeat protein/tetratricopeptide (TPR) repeat protein/tRNA A-37 threonylcarbamoyl transferase component Bud32
MGTEMDTRLERICPACGTPLPADAPKGLCPKCLAAAAEPAISAETPFPGGQPPLRNPAVRRFGDYELIGELAQGGMGIVYYARQISLQRAVAIKIIRSGLFATESEVERFRTEAQAAANLDHPNIVPLYEVGRHEGHHFLSMKLIEGGSLAEWIAHSEPELSHPRRLRRTARLIAVLARAVQHAHQRGVLHRDLKPANVLLDSEDRPYLTDFGLAKLLSREQNLTATLTVLGTPAYMAPEQAAGDSKRITTSADIYSLGAILYELLTGAPPFSGADPFLILERVRTQEPSRPRALNPKVDRDLETICLKCLEKEPARRYPTAEALAEDLDRWLAGEPILARPTSRVQRLAKWTRRDPAVASLAGMAILLFLIGLGGVLWQWRRAEQNAAQAGAQARSAESARESELAARQRAEQQELITRKHLYAGDMLLAQLALQSGDWERAGFLLDRNRPKPGEPDLRNWEWRYLWQLCQSDEEFTLGHHSDRVRCLAASPDGELLVSASDEPVLRVWNLNTGAQIASIEQKGPVYCLAFSPDGSLLASGDDNGVHIWSFPSFEPVTNLVFKGLVRSTGFSPDGRQLASFQGDGSIILRSVAEWKEEGRLRAAPLAGTLRGALAYSRQDSLLAACGGDGVILLANSATGETLRSWQAHTDSISAVCFSPDGKSLATAGWDGKLLLWSIPSGDLLFSLTGHTSIVSDVDFSPCGRLLASSSADQSIRLWDAPTGAQVDVLRGHRGEVWPLRFMPDGELLVTGGKDDAIKVWRVERSSFKATEEPLGPGIGWLAFLPDSTLLVYSPEERVCFLQLPGLPMCWSPVAGLLALADRGSFHLISTEPQAGLVSTRKAHRGRIYDMDWAPGSRMLATAGDDGLVKLWEAANEEDAITLRGHALGVSRLTFSADGQRLVTGDAGGTVKLWDLSTLQEVLVLEFPNPGKDSQWFAKLEFAPGGEALAALVRSVNNPDDPDLMRGHLWRAPSWEEIEAFESRDRSRPAAREERTEFQTVRQREGTIEDARQLQSELIEAFRKLRGREHPELQEFFQQFGFVLHHLEMIAEAEEFDREALRLWRMKPGEEEGRLATLLNNLAVALSMQGGEEKLAEAEALHREALTLRRTSPQGHDRAVAHSLGELAWVYRYQGKLDQAGQTFEEAVALLRLRMEQGGGEEEQWQLGYLLNALSDLLVQRKRFADARPLAEESFGIYHRLSQERAGMKTQAWLLLAKVLAELDDLRAWETLCAQWEAPREELAGALAVWSALLLSRNQFTEAEPMARESLAIREQMMPDHWLTFNACNLLGRSLLGQKKFALAEPMLLKGYEGMKLREQSIPDGVKHHLRDVLFALVQLYEETAQPERAMEWKQTLAAFDARAEASAGDH